MDPVSISPPEVVGTRLACGRMIKDLVFISTVLNRRVAPGMAVANKIESCIKDIVSNCRTVPVTVLFT